MARFTKLLFCVTDDDDAAVQYVARFAVATSADLMITDVIEDVPPVARRLLPRSWNLPALVRTQKQARIERAGALVRRVGVNPTTALLTGSPIKARAREIARGEHDPLAVAASPSVVVAPVRTRVPREGVHLVKGDPRVVIADFATRHGIDLDRRALRRRRPCRWRYRRGGGEPTAVHDGRR
ncbi:MAG TPA: hypothetical protein VFZ21_15430 [Gemmatimonadaceae bacterium]|nr:hypothetical protein [Gemmatimonadaceae bacterium]